MSNRIDCPIEWCTGSRLDHGGDGAEPETWVHSDDGTELVHGAALYRARTGTGADEWELIVGGQLIGHGVDLTVLSERLRDLADAVDAVAAQTPR